MFVSLICEKRKESCDKNLQELSKDHYRILNLKQVGCLWQQRAW